MTSQRGDAFDPSIVIFVFELKFLHNELMWPTRISSIFFSSSFVEDILFRSSKSSIDFVLNEKESIFYSNKD